MYASDGAIVTETLSYYGSDFRDDCRRTSDANVESSVSWKEYTDRCIVVWMEGGEGIRGRCDALPGAYAANPETVAGNVHPATCTPICPRRSACDRL